MQTREQLIHKRIIHVVIIIATSSFAYQYSNWGDALWIPISALAIIGPFTPGMSTRKAQQRMIGSIAGLFLSIVIWLLLFNSSAMLAVVATVLIYLVAFTVVQKYTYFVMLVSIMLCINFDYMNLFINNEMAYLTNRIICVFTGVAICQFYDFLIFRNSYDNAVSLIEGKRINKLIINIKFNLNNMQQYNKNLNKIIIEDYFQDIIQELELLTELKESCNYTYGNQKQTITLLDSYIDKLKLIYAEISEVAYSLSVK